MMKDGPGEQPDISRTTKNHIKHLYLHVRDAAEIAIPGLASTATQDDAHQQPLSVLLHSQMTDRCQYIYNSKSGRPHQILSQNGIEFKKLFMQVVSTLGMKQVFSSPITLEAMRTLKMYTTS